MTKPYFISEVSSNHSQDINRAKEFIQVSKEVGCNAVKFQLFKIDKLFAPEILSKSELSYFYAEAVQPKSHAQAASIQV
mgnify:CR=1 FL=1